VVKKLLLGCYIFITGSLILHGQDLHYSQFMSSPVYLNPAATGVFKGNYRIALNGKNQWQSVTQPYRTISLAFDMTPVQRRFKRDAFGAGVIVHADVAGDSKFSTTNPALTFSYIRSLDRQGTHTVSAGIQAGMVFRSISTSALSFSNQYNGYNYDPGLPNNEEFHLTNYNYFDIGAGTHWNYQFARERSCYAGIGVYHFFRPKQSFMDDRNIKLDVKWNMYAGTQLNLSPAVDITPQVLIVKQGQYNEVLMGSQVKYIQNRYSHTDYLSLNAGLYYRSKDALIFTTGFDYKQFVFGISYDMNVSSLKPATYYKGGLEFSLVYTYSKYKNKRRKEIPCPIF